MKPLRWRYWVERGVFVASVLALLATGKPPGWAISAAIVGPRAPATGRALVVSVDTSHYPKIHSTGIRPHSFVADTAPCLEPFTAGKTLSCLLPPDATLDAVLIGDGCGGCNGGCPPPAGAYVKAETKEVDVWKDVASAKSGSAFPSHDKRIATHVYVHASGARFIDVKLTVVPRGGGAPLFVEEQPCPYDFSGTPEQARCSFYVYDSALGAVHDVDLEAEATGFGDCASAGCPAPKTLAVAAIVVTPP